MSDERSPGQRVKDALLKAEMCRDEAKRLLIRMEHMGATVENPPHVPHQQVMRFGAAAQVYATLAVEARLEAQTIIIRERG